YVAPLDRFWCGGPIVSPWKTRASRRKSTVTPARARIIAAALLILTSAGLSAAQQADLNGVWQGPYVPDMSRTGRNQTGEPNLPFTPVGEKEWKSYDAANGDYTGACLPFGLSP